MASLLLLLAAFSVFRSSTSQSVCNILDYGAVGDGETVNTAAIEKAIHACSRDLSFDFSDANKNIILIPSEGAFVTGSFEFSSGLDLYLESGAVLMGSENERDYPLVDVLPSYGTGRDSGSSMRYRPLVFGQNLTYVSISGEGTLDGNGGLWWKKHFADALEYDRPALVEFMYCSHITVQDATLQNSAFWSLHPYASSDIIVQRIRILAPGYSPNTDGVDVDSSRDVLIQDCYFSLGDDGIAIKSGLDEYGRDFATPSENIYVRNITVDPQFDNFSTNGVSIGSEMSGGVRNVTFEDIRVIGVEAGIYIKTREGRGGTVEDIYYKNIYANRTLQAIKFVMHYGYRRLSSSNSSTDANTIKPSAEDDETVPHFKNIHVENYYGENILQAGDLTGLEGSTMEGVSMKNVTLLSKVGFFCSFTEGYYEDVSPSVDDCLDSLKED